MNDASPFQRAFRDELLKLPLRRPRRRRSWLGGVATAAIAAIAAAVSFLGASPAAAEVKVTIENGRVEILLTDLSSTPDDVAHAVRKAGLEARVIGEPAGPSNVGRFVQARVDGGNTTPIQRIKEGVDTFMGFSLPEGWDGTLVIAIGRPARDDEPYTIPSDVFADGEPLHCSGVLGRRLADVTDQLDSFRVRVQAFEIERMGPPVDLSEPVVNEFGDLYVARGLGSSPSDVLLQLSTRPPELEADPKC